MKNILFLLLFHCFFFSVGFCKDIKVEKESQYFPGGAVKSSYSFYLKDGKKIIHGKYSEFYSSATIYKEMKFKHGILHGEASEYYPSKNKKWEGKYKEGEKNGKWTFWSEGGNIRMKGKFNSKGQIKYFLRFHDNGNKKRKELYENGVLVKILLWDVAGNLKSERRIAPRHLREQPAVKDIFQES